MYAIRSYYGSSSPGGVDQPHDHTGSGQGRKYQEFVAAEVAEHALQRVSSYNFV